MMAYLRTVARRVLAIAALVAGMLLAALFAALTLAAALAIGAALWLANRFGLRATRPQRGAAAPRETEIIDVEMREVETGLQDGDTSSTPREETSPGPARPDRSGPSG
jgi:hypothetical protein